jgi:HSP20 family protein
MFRRRPLTDLDHLHDHIERIWERLTQGLPPQAGFCAPALEPPADVLLTEDQIIVRLEIAGLRGSEVDVEVADGRLTVRGTKQDPPRPPDARYTQMEIVGGAFERSVELPAEVNAGKASVEYADGYLEIHLPRVHRPAERHVKVPVRRA